jgi:hypothetical protein
MKPITIIVEEEEYDYNLTMEMKNILDERFQEDEATYITAEQSIKQL